MTNIGDIIRNVLAAAQQVTAAIPGAQGISALAGTGVALVGIGEKLVDVIDGLTDKAPDPRTQAEMQEARRALAAAVSAKADATADRLDGGN